MADDGNQDADQQARDLAANAAKERAKRLADQLAIEHAEREYDAARQQAAGGVAFQPRRQGRLPYQGPPLAQPRIGDAIGDPPPPPRYAVDTAAALTAATQAMAAIADSLGRSGSNSRGRDGDIVIYKDISQVFDEVPEDILERVKYVKTVVNRLNVNTSGVRFKTSSDNILSIRVSDDNTVPTNYRMYTFENVDIVVPFAVVFSDAGKNSSVMLTNSDGADCYVPIPTIEPR